MSKPKRNISGNALLRRAQFLTESGSDDDDQQTAAAPAADQQTTAASSEAVPRTPDGDVQEPVESPDEPQDESPVQEPETTGLSKKLLLQHFIDAKNEELDTDLIYFPKALYAAFRAVWYERKKEQRGYKKSNVIIEALLRHPDILKELQRQGFLKQ